MSCYPPDPKRQGCIAGLLLVVAPWVIAAIVAVLLLMYCVGCGRRAPVVTPPVAGPLPVYGPELPADATPLQRAQAIIDQLDRERATAVADLEIAQKAERQARIDGLRRVAWWVAGIAALGIFACVALAIVLPVGKKIAATAGAACAAVVVVALGFDQVLPYLPVIGLLLVLAAGAWGIWQVVKLVRVARESAAHGDRMENVVRSLKAWIPEDADAFVETAIADAKADSATKQERAGVRKYVAAVRRKPIKPVAPTAPTGGGF